LLISKTAIATDLLPNHSMAGLLAALIAASTCSTGDSDIETKGDEFDVGIPESRRGSRNYGETILEE
jgi:hypothetical protein